MEKVTLVETFKLSDEETKVLGEAVNVLADIADFVQTELTSGVRVELPVKLTELMTLFEANINDLKVK